jgi:hypothetical protein
METRRLFDPQWYTITPDENHRPDKLYNVRGTFNAREFPYTQYKATIDELTVKLERERRHYARVKDELLRFIFHVSPDAKDLHDMNEDIHAFLEALPYVPGGPGYAEAEAEFEDQTLDRSVMDDGNT